MKKTAVMSGLVLVSFLFVFHSLYAQGFYRYDPIIEDDYYGLNLTQEQIAKIDALELELEKELSPLIAKLRSNYAVLDDLEAQRDPDPSEINQAWDLIYKLEDDIQKKEILHEKKIRDLLTEDQKALFDAYYAYGASPYERGGFGRGIRGGRYGYGYGAGMGRGVGMLGRGYYGYGRGITRGYGRNMGYFGRGAGRMGYGNSRFLRGVRYGRGPCGAGLGRWYRWNYYRFRWNQ